MASIPLGLTPPVEDGTSVDTTRCIRADYADPIYAELATEAQKKIEADPELSKFNFKQGMTFACDGMLCRFFNIWKKGMKNVKSRQEPSSVVEMSSAEQVFRRIHRPIAEPVPEIELGREHHWNIGYCNLEDAFIDVTECVRIYYERCLAAPSISFRCGVAVSPVGVTLEDGSTINDRHHLVAAGAWSNILVYLEGLTYSSAIEIAWLKVSDEETQKWKNMSITTNLSSGFNILPPYSGEIKCLRRSAGYCNTIVIPQPEDASKPIERSFPRTIVTNPTDVIPEEAERALRDNLSEIMPPLAKREFDRTKLCWMSQTPSADFIIAPHPCIENIHVATGGSAHAWKFLPIIGDLVVDSMTGRLKHELKEKWAWGHRGSDGGNAPRIDDKAKELRDVVRSQYPLEEFEFIAVQNKGY
ncbi:DEHA2F00396p [Paecilomyces variotii No. 5]|uniref:DEHA2F00396p n=1 Tax=Byssochlamys spectabilis (strain No. 5 / NBRC 109023) TaxID=1356009 RepID=V5FDP3_BYSSN|nr:DEHA2F00396p [Paecilomyces variotii No. 5]